MAVCGEEYLARDSPKLPTSKWLTHL